MKTELLEDDLIQAYSAASQFDTSKPANATADAILSYAARATKAANIDTQGAAQNDHNWRMTGTRALGGLLLVGVVGVLAVRMFPSLQNQEGLAVLDRPQEQTEIAIKSEKASKKTSAGKAPTLSQNSFEAGTTSENKASAVVETAEEKITAKPAIRPAPRLMDKEAMDTPSAAALTTAPVAAASMRKEASMKPRALTASEQLLALINDEHGACKSPPNLEAVRRLLAQGANPNYKQSPLDDHGTLLRRAQLCGFGDVVTLFAQQ